MDEYSIAVALYDYVPVALSAAAMGLLAHSLSQNQPALRIIVWTGAFLVPLGGLCKASWKLLIAWQGLQLDWLENLLFICLAPGFTVLAYGLWAFNQQRHAKIVPTHQYLLPGLLSIALGGAALAALAMPERRVWFFWLLAITTLANAGLIWQALRLARSLALGIRAHLPLILSFVATLGMSGLSRLPAGETTAWIQESVNLFAQLCLLLGIIQIHHGLRTRP